MCAGGVAFLIVSHAYAHKAFVYLYCHYCSPYNEILSGTSAFVGHAVIVSDKSHASLVSSLYGNARLGRSDPCSMHFLCNAVKIW